MAGDFTFEDLGDELDAIALDTLGRWDDDVHGRVRLLCAGCVASWYANGLDVPALVEWIGRRETDPSGRVPGCESCGETTPDS